MLDGRRISRATITEQLEEALRLDILTGTLPPGTRIRANEMAERYGVSATPLREALQRLAGENLVDLDPRLGATVAPLTERELRDIYGMLGRLDGLALERSIANGDDDWRRRVERAFEALSAPVARREGLGDRPDDRERRAAARAWSAAHWRFHEALYSACGSPWLLRFVRQLHAHSDRYQIPTMFGPTLPRRDTRAEHGEIMNAALAGDADSAVRSLRRHLTQTVEILHEEMQRTERSSGSDTHTPGDAAGGVRG